MSTFPGFASAKAFDLSPGKPRVGASYYRREIDGLRAISVLSVVFYHANFAGFSGGFIGVDVFFVISGYLITSITATDLRAAKFRLLNFYQRRARRILPALLFVLLCCIPTAVLLMIPFELEAFFEALAATLLFVSNIFFFAHTDYFDPGTYRNPLIHTWSLSVEEQFYLLFPLIMILTHRLFPARLFTVILILWFTSLAICLGTVVALSTPAFLDTTNWSFNSLMRWNFYLLPTRAWELLSGALLALSTGQTLPIRHRFGNVLSAVGLGLIFVAVYTFDEASPTLGAFLMAPVAGAVLVLAYAAPGTVVHRLLAHPWAVAIGLISYSLYLWHQPVFAFALVASPYDLSGAVFLILIGLSCFLAWLTWFFVEQPWRAQSRPRTIFSAAALLSAIMLAAATYGIQSKGLERHFLAGLSETQAAIVVDSPKSNYDNGDCKFMVDALDEGATGRFARCRSRYGEALVVVGDSHGADIYRAIAYASQFPFVFGLTKGGCRPYGIGEKCFYTDLLEFTKKHSQDIQAIIYAQSGAWLLTKGETSPGKRDFSRREVPFFAVDNPSINAVSDYLLKVSLSVPVIWLGSRIEPHIDIKLMRHLAVACQQGAANMQVSILRSFKNLEETLLGRLKNVPTIKYASLVNAMKFDIARDLYDCSAVFWFDGDHWSAKGVERFGPRIWKVLLEQYPELLASSLEPPLH